MQKVLSVGLIIALGAFIVGCEWDSTSEGESWNDSFSWADFGGVYRPIAGRAFLIDSFEAGTTVPASTGSGSQSLGTGTGLQANFGGTLGNTPINPGSVSVTDGTQTLLDPSGDGSLVGDGTGSVNYQTGGIVASFTLAPGAGKNVIASYNYQIEGTTANPAPGSSPAIYTMTVDQTGQRLAMQDSNGMSYSGDITSMAGGDGGGTASGAVVANFSVTGADGSKITGVFQGDYTVAGTDGAGAASGTLNRSMNGTYVSASGGTGDVLGQAPAIQVTVISSGTNDTDTATN